jgi:hypothetical protein
MSGQWVVVVVASEAYDVAVCQGKGLHFADMLPRLKLL